MYETWFFGTLLASLLAFSFPRMFVWGLTFSYNNFVEAFFLLCL